MYDTQFTTALKAGYQVSYACGYYQIDQVPSGVQGGMIFTQLARQADEEKFEELTEGPSEIDLLYRILEASDSAAFVEGMRDKEQGAKAAYDLSAFGEVAPYLHDSEVRFMLDQLPDQED